MISPEANRGEGPGQPWPGLIPPPQWRRGWPEEEPPALAAAGERPPPDQAPGGSTRRLSWPVPALSRPGAEDPAGRAPFLAGPPPRARYLADGTIAVAGAHGGSGCSTLAALLAPARDLGVLRPGHMRKPPELGVGPVVLTARNTAAGATRAISVAGTVVTAWRVRLLAVAVVSDGLPELADAAYRYRLLSYRVPVIRVPFVAAIRAGGDPLAAALPRRARHALTDIRALVGPPVFPPARS